MRNIYIADCGTGSKIQIERGKLTVMRGGGCPADTILHGIRNYSDAQRLADVVLARWMRGYDGDPRENGLFVEVSTAQGESLATARA